MKYLVLALAIGSFFPAQSLLAQVQDQIDVVSDIDGTIGYLIQGDVGGPNDPTYPDGQVFTIVYNKSGEITPTRETYRIYGGVPEGYARIKEDPHVRLSFFSGGSVARNLALLKAVHLPDGSTLLDAAYRVRGLESLSKVKDSGSFLEMYRKDICVEIAPDCERAIVLDDKDFRADTKIAWVDMGHDYDNKDRFRRGLRILLRTLQIAESEHVLPVTALAEVQRVSVGASLSMPPYFVPCSQLILQTGRFHRPPL